MSTPYLFGQRATIPHCMNIDWLRAPRVRLVCETVALSSCVLFAQVTRRQAGMLMEWLAKCLHIDAGAVRDRKRRKERTEHLILITEEGLPQAAL